MMMIRLLLFTMLTINMGVTAFGQSDVAVPIIDSVTWKTLTKEAYEIKYPSNWDLDESGLMGANLFLFTKLTDSTDQFRENINLMIQDLSGYDLTLDQYTEMSVGQIKTYITDGKLISLEKFTDKDLAYQKIIYTGVQGTFNLKFQQFYWVADNKATILTLTCEEDQFDNYIEVGEKILNSFKFN